MEPIDRERRAWVTGGVGPAAAFSLPQSALTQSAAGGGPASGGWPCSSGSARLTGWTWTELTPWIGRRDEEER